MTAILVDDLRDLGGLRELTLPEELDLVCGGDASISAMLTGNATVNITGLLDVLPGVFSVAQIGATITPFGSATVTLRAVATS